MPGQSPLIVFAVVYSSYDPAEVDSLWTTRESADARCAEANRESAAEVPGGNQWKVEPWEVRE